MNFLFPPLFTGEGRGGVGRSAKIRLVYLMANQTARSLRKRMTPHEIKLWVQLRLLPKTEFRFRRQVPLGGYVVDFAEKRLRLVIEVDGSQHAEPEARQRDEARDLFLAKNGYRVLRFWNHDIDTNMSGVIDTILIVLQS